MNRQEPNWRTPAPTETIELGQEYLVRSINSRQESDWHLLRCTLTPFRPEQEPTLAFRVRAEEGQKPSQAQTAQQNNAGQSERLW